jgi:alkylation response protein AidB-like acyl-CoA dehydrogenase
METELGFAEEDWRELAELGWAGLAVPSEHGGQGLGMVELAVTLEQMGYALAPSPLLSNTLASLLLTAAGTDEQKRDFLAPIASGERRATLALFDAGTRAEPGTMVMEAGSDGDATLLDGEKLMVMDAAAADWLIVGTVDGARHIVDRDADGVSIELQPTIDLTRKHYAVRLDGVRVAAERTIPSTVSDLPPVHGRICVALAAELVGIAQRTMEMAVEYAKEREQFGRPIGAYQAVSHRCAEMLLETESARSTTYWAAWAADAEPETLPLASSMAKARASDAGFRVAASSLQVHGGIGFTWEHDLHLWLRRARADAAAFGDANWYRERVAQLVFDQDRETATEPSPAAAPAPA